MKQVLLLFIGFLCFPYVNAQIDQFSLNYGLNYNSYIISNYHRSDQTNLGIDTGAFNYYVEDIKPFVSLGFEISSALTISVNDLISLNTGLGFNYIGSSYEYNEYNSLFGFHHTKVNKQFIALSIPIQLKMNLLQNKLSYLFGPKIIYKFYLLHNGFPFNQNSFCLALNSGFEYNIDRKKHIGLSFSYYFNGNDWDSIYKVYDTYKKLNLYNIDIYYSRSF
jgi:hypothetical protein